MDDVFEGCEAGRGCSLKEGRGFEISDDIDSRKKTGFKVARPV